MPNPPTLIEQCEQLAKQISEMEAALWVIENEASIPAGTEIKESEPLRILNQMLAQAEAAQNAPKIKAEKLRQATQALDISRAALAELETERDLNQKDYTTGRQQLSGLIDQLNAHTHAYKDQAATLLAEIEKAARKISDQSSRLYGHPMQVESGVNWPRDGKWANELPLANLFDHRVKLTTIQSERDLERRRNWEQNSPFQKTPATTLPTTDIGEIEEDSSPSEAYI